MYLKEERDNIQEERDALRNQYVNGVKALNREHEEFMVEEHSEWFSKTQRERERAELLLGIQTHKTELEYCIEEFESYLTEREKKLEEERIQSIKDSTKKKLKHVQVELKGMGSKRLEIKFDCKSREKKWADLNLVEELKILREKLERRRHMLLYEREDLQHEIEELMKLENLKVALDDMYMAKIQLSNLEHSWEKVSQQKPKVVTRDNEVKLRSGVSTVSNIEYGYNSFTEKLNCADGVNLSSLAPLSWIKKFQFTKECVKIEQVEAEYIPGHEQRAYTLTEPLVRINIIEMRDHIGVQDVLKEDFKLKGENVGISLKITWSASYLILLSYRIGKYLFVIPNEFRKY
ncbi:Protein CROWDED NUCLEI 4 [Raphanus sativus]|nr:Protein CROWDED NUCLEI 4 [Raphanus sativus]